MTDRISLATIFNGQFKHIKRTVKNFLKPFGIGNILQTTITDDVKQTSLLMEGQDIILHATRNKLESFLHQLYPEMGTIEWAESFSGSPIYDSHIRPTFGCLSRSSSGFDELLHEELSEKSEIVDKSNWEKRFHPTFIQAVSLIQRGAEVYHDIQSSVATFQEKVVHITYKDTTVQMNVGVMVFWSVFITFLQICKKLKIVNCVTGVYCLIGNDKSYVLGDLSLLKAGERYYVECDGDALIDNVILYLFIYLKC